MYTPFEPSFLVVGCFQLLLHCVGGKKGLILTNSSLMLLSLGCWQGSSDMKFSWPLTLCMKSNVSVYVFFFFLLQQGVVFLVNSFILFAFFFNFYDRRNKWNVLINKMNVQSSFNLNTFQVGEKKMYLELTLGLRSSKPVTYSLNLSAF